MYYLIELPILNIYLNIELTFTFNYLISKLIQSCNMIKLIFHDYKSSFKLTFTFNKITMLLNKFSIFKNDMLFINILLLIAY